MFAQKTEYFIDFYVQNPRTYMNNNQIKVEDCTLREKFSFNDYDNKQTIRSLKEYFLTFFGHKYQFCTCQLMLFKKNSHIFNQSFFEKYDRLDNTLINRLNTFDLYLIKINDECICNIEPLYYLNKYDLIKKIESYKKLYENRFILFNDLDSKTTEEIKFKKKELSELLDKYNKLIKIHEENNRKEEELYDIIIYINSIKDLKNGWRIEMSDKGEENYKEFKNKKLLKIGVIGNSKKGKSFILNKISNIDLIIGASNQTNGLSIKYPSKNKKFKNDIILLDCEGLENPILFNNEEKKEQKIEKKDDKEKEEKKEEEAEDEKNNREEMNNKVKKFENKFYKEYEFKEKIKDKIMTDFFLQNFILKNSDILLVVVGRMTYSEQLLIKKIKEECKKEKKNKLFIIHNLQMLRKKEQIEQYINNILIKSSNFKFEENNSYYFDDNNNDMKYQKNEKDENENNKKQFDNKNENFIQKEDNNININNEENKEIKINDSNKESILDKSSNNNDKDENNIDENAKNEFNLLKSNKNNENELKEEKNEIENNNIHEKNKPSHFCEIMKYDDGQTFIVYHLIIANEDSEAGKFYNEYAYNFIKKFYNQAAGLNSFDIFKEIKNAFKYLAPKILYKQIKDIKFNEYEDIKNKKIIKLELEEDLDLKDCFFEESNSFFKNLGFQPKYNCYKVDDKTLEIRLEIPGNLSYNIEKYVEADKTKIRITGEKKQDKNPPNEENIIYNNREFTNYEVIISLSTEKYLIASQSPKKGYPMEKRGLLIIQYELLAKGNILSDETNKDDEV